MSPEMTGETAKGRSIRVMRRLLPRKENFAIAQAAATPKITLAGTAIAAVSSVSRMAAKASALAKDAKYAARPCPSASAKTAAKGSTRKKPRKSRATAGRVQRTQAASRVARGAPARRAGWDRVLTLTAAILDAIKPAAPLLEQ